LQVATALVLLLAANTSFNGFPRLLSIMARNGHAPRLCLRLGDRLAFSNGTIALAAAAAVLFAAFAGRTDALIPLYAVGVFVAFTFSQVGMVVHWWRRRDEHWRRSMLLNGVGAAVSAVVFVVAAVTKFGHGAWVALVLIALLVLIAWECLIRTRVAGARPQCEVMPRVPTRALYSPFEIRLEPLPLELLRPALGAGRWGRLDAALADASPALGGATIWMVNSTAVGGGVAELLRVLVPYWCGAGLEVRWVVVRAPPRFFTVTKRLHNWLHGHPGDGRELGDRERRIYEQVLAGNAAWLADQLRPRDVVVCHDPQTAGLLPALATTGATLVWRSHVGADRPNELTRAGWEFLGGYLGHAAAVVFTRVGSVPPQLAGLPVWVIAPCIDPCATKNRELPTESGAAILAHTGIASAATTAAPVAIARNGRPIAVRRRCLIRRAGPAPRLGRDRIVLHLARWDRLKDPVGILDCFVAHVLSQTDAHLLLAGPTLGAVADDPEATAVYRQVEQQWSRLAPRARGRLHLIRLPMRDLDENAAIVNGLQTYADVVVKKSLEEGFGLGVTEAMWKRRAVVASGVGGQREQIEDRVSGVLIADARDLAAVGAAVVDLLDDPSLSRKLGAAAQRRVRDRFLPDRHVEQWLKLLTALATKDASDHRAAGDRA
jgi:trehalose synthase